MKYILIIWVCSFINQNGCMEPITYSKLYDSWYECSRTAHQQSLSIMSKMGYKNVNKYQVGTKYSCKVVPTY